MASVATAKPDSAQAVNAFKGAYAMATGALSCHVQTPVLPSDLFCNTTTPTTCVDSNLSADRSFSAHGSAVFSADT